MAFRFPFALNGHGYIAELEGDALDIATLETMREQQDASSDTGEQTLSPYDLWRRSINDFRGGEGQSDGDGPESHPRRFKHSEGLDVWSRNGVKPLPATLQITENGGKPLAVGDRLYWLRGNEYRYIEEIGGQETVVQLPAYSGSFATDGFNIYFAGQTLRMANLNVNQPATINNLSCDKVWYVKGRLMVAAAADLYNITDITDPTPPSPLTPLAINDDWEWMDMCDGGNFIYACGYSGDRGTVYRITIREDGTALDAPVAAVDLPAGEIPLSIHSYGGKVWIGTNLGLRLAHASTGSLFFGPLLEVGPVYSITSFGHELFFTWNTWTEDEFGDPNTGTGIGKVDLSAPFVDRDGLQPPYSTWLNVTGSANEVHDVAVYNGKPVFHTFGRLFTEDPGSLRSAGRFLETSKYDFNVAEKKSFELIQVATEPLAWGETVQIEVFVDDQLVETFTHGDPDGLADDPQESIFHIGAHGDRIHARLTLSSNVTLRRVTFRAYPTPRKGTEFILPLVLRREVQDRNGRVYRYNVKEEYKFLKSLERQSVTLTMFGEDIPVVVDRVLMGRQLTYLPDMDFVEGIFFVQMRGWG